MPASVIYSLVRDPPPPPSEVTTTQIELSRDPSTGQNSVYPVVGELSSADLLYFTCAGEFVTVYVQRLLGNVERIRGPKPVTECRILNC